MEQPYLESVLKQFHYYKKIAEQTFSQLSEKELFWQYNEESNSIAIIVQHLSGNMLSRWTDFLTTDGEKDWRRRDAEFENEITDREELILLWEKGWKALFDALESLDDIDLQTLVYIRNEGHTIMEAINRQLAHYPYHIGQIVFIGKMLQGQNWLSLSIPKGQSAVYNQEKFDQPKVRKHFTDQ